MNRGRLAWLSVALVAMLLLIAISPGSRVHRLSTGGPAANHTVRVSLPWRAELRSSRALALAGSDGRRSLRPVVVGTMCSDATRRPTNPRLVAQPGKSPEGARERRPTEMAVAVHDQAIRDRLNARDFTPWPDGEHRA